MTWFQAVIQCKPRKPHRSQMIIPPDGVIRHKIWAVDSWSAMNEFKAFVVEQGIDVLFFKMREVE